jgi:hypothetical protein
MSSLTEEPRLAAHCLVAYLTTNPNLSIDFYAQRFEGMFFDDDGRTFS